MGEKKDNIDFDRIVAFRGVCRLDYDDPIDTQNPGEHWSTNPLESLELFTGIGYDPDGKYSLDSLDIEEFYGAGELGRNYLFIANFHISEIDGTINNGPTTGRVDLKKLLNPRGTMNYFLELNKYQIPKVFRGVTKEEVIQINSASSVLNKPSIDYKKLREILHPIFPDIYRVR